MHGFYVSFLCHCNRGPLGGVAHALRLGLLALLLWMHHFNARLSSCSGLTEACKGPLVETLLVATWLKKGLLDGCFWGLFWGPPVLGSAP